MKYCLMEKNNPAAKVLAAKLKNLIKHDYDDVNPDYVVVLGGDGTFLKAARKYPNAIIFAIHMGHLGFYAKYKSDNLDDLINDINNETFKVKNADMIHFEIKDSANNIISGDALNEVTAITTLKTFILDVYIDGELFEKFRGTGMCISTPTGSTAYNKSLHGSVIDDDLQCLQLAEIAGINSNAYRSFNSAIVFNKKRVIELNSQEPIDAFINADIISYNVPNFKSLKVYYSDAVVKMAYHNAEETLTERLKRTFIESE